MPVLITGAHTVVGQRVARMLLAGGGQVRAYVDESQAREGLVDELRARGCKVARGTLDDEGLLELALEQVHTVAHLATGFLDEPRALLDDVASVAAAAMGAGCRRFLWLSHLGADGPRGDPLLEACAEAEGLLAEAPFETVVVRRDVTYAAEDPFTRALAGGVPDALRDVRRAPLYVDDLAAAVAAADRHRQDTSAPQIVVEIAGPDTVTLGEFAGQLGSGPIRGLDTSLPPHTVRLLSVSREPGPGTLGREGTTVAEGLRRLEVSDG